MQWFWATVVRDGVTDPSEHRWTWSADQTAGFVRRRQAHEAMRVMFGAPRWGRVERDRGATVRIRTTDTGRSWRVTLGSFSGTSREGTTYSGEPVLEVADADTGGDVAATVEGGAGRLD